MARIHIVVFAALVAVVGCKRTEVTSAKTVAEPAPVNAAVLRITPEPFTATIPVTGTLVSNSRVDVKAETTGKITRFDKQEGDLVRAGEPVVWVDQENYNLAIRQADSSVQVAEAALQRTRVLESHGKAEFERAENLLKSGGITEKDYKLAQVTVQESNSQVALAQAQLEQARVAAEVARKHLRDSVVRAPVTGEIQKKFVNPGAYVEPPTALFALVDNGRLELEALIPSSDMGPVRAGQRVTFVVNSYPGERFEGRVIELGPAVESESRSGKVRIAVNAGGKLKAGMFAEGEILTGVEQRAIIIPATAVQRDDRSAKDSVVFVVENGKAAKRPVRIGRERDSRLEIVSGLKDGDLIVAEQSIEIADGVKVSPREVARVSQ